MRFPTREALSNHRYYIHREIMCLLCNQEFPGRNSLRDHVKEFHPGTPVYKACKRLVCEYCSATYATQWHLTDHIQSKHMGHVNQCNTCGKRLGSAETLKIHQKLHKPETYRTCEVCGKQFSRLALLTEHLRSYHPENVPESSRLQLNCPYCNACFSRRGSMRRHIENKHDHIIHPCEICGKQFHCRRYLLRHRRVYHLPGGKHYDGISGRKNVDVEQVDQFQCLETY